MLVVVGVSVPVPRPCACLVADMEDATVALPTPAPGRSSPVDAMRQSIISVAYGQYGTIVSALSRLGRGGIELKWQRRGSIAWNNSATVVARSTACLVERLMGFVKVRGCSDEGSPQQPKSNG